MPEVTREEFEQLERRIAALEVASETTVKELAVPTKSKRGTRLEPGWIPRSDTVEKIVAELRCDKEALVREHRKFCDYFFSVPGQRGVKLDWDRAWCNWMRTASERGSFRSTGTVADKSRGWMEMDVAEG